MMLKNSKLNVPDDCFYFLHGYAFINGYVYKMC